MESSNGSLLEAVLIVNHARVDVLEDGRGGEAISQVGHSVEILRRLGNDIYDGEVCLENMVEKFVKRLILY